MPEIKLRCNKDEPGESDIPRYLAQSDVAQAKNQTIEVEPTLSSIDKYAYATMQYGLTSGSKALKIDEPAHAASIIGKKRYTSLNSDLPGYGQQAGAVNDETVYGIKKSDGAKISTKMQKIIHRKR